MYTPEHENVSHIIKDDSIMLPRFQRKKSWDDDTRFKLCISLFKEYPVGTIVLKKETKNGKTVKWLLDGRQRRDTLIEMQNPDKVYSWARSFLKFKKSVDVSVIKDLFNNKLSEYLYYDEEEDGKKESVVFDECIKNIDDDNDDDDFGSTPYELGDTLDKRDSEALKDLLFIIETVHRKSGSNFTEPFNFKVKDFKPSFLVKNERGTLYVDSTKLTKWIISKDFKDIDNLTPDQIIENVDNCPESVGDCIRNNIDAIKKSIKCVDIIQNRLTSAKVSIILLDESCEESDSQKIFEIINTHGQKLTNAEVLSAKPIWNASVSEPRPEIISSVNKLYEGLGTEKQEKIVKWDVAATLADRLPPKSDYIFGDLRSIPFRSETKNESVKVDEKINYGFKLLAARYSRSISKNEVDELAHRDFDWNSIEFEDEIKNVCTFLMKNDAAIERFSTYHHSLRSIVGDTVAMFYIILLIDKYNELTNNGENELKGKNKKDFIVKSRKLFDRLFYEYCTGLWKGSSDSRLKKYLDKPEIMFSSIDSNDWAKLINDAYYQNKIGNSTISGKVLAALIYYSTMLRNKKLDCDEENGAQIDHIIPQARFTDGSSNYGFKDSLANCALITANLNNKKKTNITSIDTAYIDAICDLEDVDQDVIKRMTGPDDIPELIKHRAPIVNEILKEREGFVKGEGFWVIKV